MVLNLDMPEHVSRIMLPLLPFTNGNGLPGGGAYTETFKLHLPPHIPSQDVRVEVSCLDGLTNEHRTFIYGYRWGGSEVAGDLQPAPKDRLMRLNEYVDLSVYR